MNVVLASVGGNYQALGNARSALCLVNVNRPYSTAEFSNKVDGSFIDFVISMYCNWGFCCELWRAGVIGFTCSLIVGSFFQVLQQ